MQDNSGQFDNLFIHSILCVLHLYKSQYVVYVRLCSVSGYEILYRQGIGLIMLFGLCMSI